MISSRVKDALESWDFRDATGEKYDAFYEALAKVVEAAEKIDCQCDARWSGRDEAEYCARGCPDCSCEHHKALRELELRLKEVGV